MRRFIASITSLVVLCTCCAAVAADTASNAAADDAARVLQTSAVTYAGLQSYRDVGVVTDPEFGDLTFDTAFTRPDRFRFGYTEGHPYILLRFVRTTRILRSDGKRTTIWEKTSGDDPIERDEPSLALGVAGMTGVSRGAAHRIATMLMPHLWDAEPFGSSVLAVTGPRLLADESIDGVRCRHVAGTTRKGGHLELWIGSADHLVRRIDSDRYGGGIETQLFREIHVDEAVPASAFSTVQATR